MPDSVTTSATTSATTPAPTPAPTFPAPAASDRADRTRAGLSVLFAERPELRGVHAPADLTEDAIRWSA